jgi:transcriptional regulator with XRE-family HTH domain
MMTLQQQLQLLWKYVLVEGRKTSTAEVSRRTGITQQALLNLLHGRVHDPRLDTLQCLVQYFGISLDYFNLTSEAACLTYLAQAGRLGAAPDVLQHIHAQASRLSPAMLHDILTLIQWRVMGNRSSL